MKMPALTRHHLASRLRSNWMAKHPMDCNSNGGTTLDDSLTSLNWLQNLNIMKITSPGTTMNHVTTHDNQKNLKVNPNTVLNVTNVPIKQEPTFSLGDTPPSTPTSFGNEVDYSTNPYVKPPYSYATLICMAMKETKKSKITLSAIYNWITENFMYYRVADPSWQNSIRHNLSLNKCFQKVPRRKDEPGKGGFWRINPEHGDLLENGVFKKRRNSRDVCLTPSKRMKSVDDDDFDYCDQQSDNKLTQEGSDPSLVRVGTADLDDTHLPDFNWASILNQDIEIGGVTVKTEYLLDKDHNASPLIEMSPPSSETNSDDIGFDDFLVHTDFTSDLSNDAVDCTSNSPLDLTVSGQSIKAPDWWEETLEGSEENRDPNVNNGRNGLHTPVTVEENPWTEQCRDYTGLDDIAAAFDIDNLFDVENIPSPKIG